MNKSSNVIDLKSRRPQMSSPVKVKTNSASPSPVGSAEIVDMTERRNEILSHERRDVRRTILTEFIGAQVIVPNRGLQKVMVYDISQSGIAFDMDAAEGRFLEGEEIGFRVYMNQQTYFPFVVKISNVRLIEEEGVIRHGCQFVRGTVNDKALAHFVGFIESVSASLRTDHGDVLVSGLLK